MKKMKPFLMLGCMALFLAGCSRKKETEESGSGKLSVVCTATMVTDLVKRVAGERVEVTGIMGPGVDPHSYQPKLSDTLAVQEADAVFYCGLHLEGKMQDSLEALAKRKPAIIAVTDSIPKEQLLAPEEDFPGHYDPHVWGSPRLWSFTVKSVVDGLSKVDPEGAETYRAQGEAYHKELEALHQWALKRAAEVPEEQRFLVTSHDAFFYFGNAFHFEVKGLQGLSTVSEVGLKDRAQLVTMIREKGVRAIFPESSVNPKALEAVAKESGVKVSHEELFSDAMGVVGDVVTMGEESYDKGTYIGMIKHNVNTVVNALK